MPIPTWLAATLMDAGTNNAADLCLIAIQAIRDFDMRATASPAAAATLAKFEHVVVGADESKDDEPDVDTDEPNNNDVVLIAPSDTAQAILRRIPVFLWAVAATKIIGCEFTLADSLPVEPSAPGALDCRSVRWEASSNDNNNNNNSTKST
jgi:hypothetical protein